MVIGSDYATLAELKAYLRITDAEDDTELTEKLTGASREIEKHCRRQFNQTTTATARAYYPLHPQLVFADDFHTTTDLDIAVDEDGDGTFERTLTSAEYQLDPLNGVVDGVDGWPFWRIRAVESALFLHARVNRRPSVQVTAQWGWAEVPAPVHEACLIIAAETFKLRDAPFGVAGFGDYGVVRVRDNPKAASKLNPYRRNAVRVG